MAKKKSKSGTQVAGDTSNIDSVTIELASLRIDRRVLSMSSNQSNGMLVLPHRNRRRRRDIVAEFNDYFGDESVLQNWQRMCMDVGVEEDLPSITKCRKALKKVWVNIYDLVDARKNNRLPVRQFPNQNALIQYTLIHKKIFPKKEAKKNGPVKALLRNIF